MSESHTLESLATNGSTSTNVLIKTNTSIETDAMTLPSARDDRPEESATHTDTPVPAPVIVEQDSARAVPNESTDMILTDTSKITSGPTERPTESIVAQVEGEANATLTPVQPTQAVDAVSADQNLSNSIPYSLSTTSSGSTPGRKERESWGQWVRNPFDPAKSHYH